jgi:hypothetical protein
MIVTTRGVGMGLGKSCGGVDDRQGYDQDAGKGWWVADFNLLRQDNESG